MNILHDDPIFTVDIEGFNMSYFVKINGVAIYRENNHNGQVSLTVPANHFVHPENSSFAIDVIPPETGKPFKSNARAKAELKVHSHGNPEHKVTIAWIDFNEKSLKEGDPTRDSSNSGRFELTQDLEEKSEGRIEVGEVVAKPDPSYEGSVMYERKLTIPNALPLWAFFDSDELPNYFTIPDEEYYPERDSLLKEYQKIQSAIESGNIDSVMPMFEERNRETDLAFYREPGTTENGLLQSLEESSKDDNLKLMNLESRHVDLFHEENRKLVRLLRADDMAAIGLNFVEGQGAINYDLVFRRKNGDWILTR